MMTRHTQQRVLVTACLLTLLGCASAPTTVELPSQTLRQGLIEENPSPENDPLALRAEETPESATIPPPQPAPPAQEEEGSTTAHTTTIVISEQSEGREVTPQELVAASQREKARRASASTPVLVVTNDNLEESGVGGQITIAESTRAPADDLADAETESESDSLVREEYWRSRALQGRLEWKGAIDDVANLEAEAAELRTRFYAEDDPFYRDNEIKPRWDRALDNLATAKLRVVEAQKSLDVILEEGRRAGALPGWLREGIEYEPETPDVERRRRDDPREPVIVDEGQWLDP